MYPVSQIDADHEFLRAADFQESVKLISTDSKAAMLHGKLLHKHNSENKTSNVYQYLISKKGIKLTKT